MERAHGLPARLSVALQKAVLLNALHDTAPADNGQVEPRGRPHFITADGGVAGGGGGQWRTAGPACESVRDGSLEVTCQTDDAPLPTRQAPQAGH